MWRFRGWQLRARSLLRTGTITTTSRPSPRLSRFTRYDQHQPSVARWRAAERRPLLRGGSRPPGFRRLGCYPVGRWGSLPNAHSHPCEKTARRLLDGRFIWRFRGSATARPQFKKDWGRENAKRAESRPALTVYLHVRTPPLSQEPSRQASKNKPSVDCSTGGQSNSNCTHSRPRKPN
jgi:hypothetical protein